MPCHQPGRIARQHNEIPRQITCLRRFLKMYMCAPTGSGSTTCKPDSARLRIRHEDGTVFIWPLPSVPPIIHAFPAPKTSLEAGVRWPKNSRIPAHRFSKQICAKTDFAGPQNCFDVVEKYLRVKWKLVGSAFVVGFWAAYLFVAAFISYERTG
ncbi:unnamed protein product [Protopolystoma xenopodis]|uniref:Uncharacterized protein n=1 Tax=Protopolystoma xenopodis TaxID=117903 RepID=A0A3S5ABH6_9PLAT|nr:unnamed protein product [Protopolystoma xenopodis]